MHKENNEIKIGNTDTKGQGSVTFLIGTDFRKHYFKMFFTQCDFGNPSVSNENYKSKCSVHRFKIILCIFRSNFDNWIACVRNPQNFSLAKNEHHNIRKVLFRFRLQDVQCALGIGSAVTQHSCWCARKPKRGRSWCGWPGDLLAPRK